MCRIKKVVFEQTSSILIIQIEQLENHQKVGVLPIVTPGMEWVLTGEGIATEKMDGSCCTIIDGVFYKRYDAKRGKTPLAGAIPCCEPDAITGHWPHWVKVNPEDRGDLWHIRILMDNRFLMEHMRL